MRINQIIKNVVMRKEVEDISGDKRRRVIEGRKDKEGHKSKDHRDKDFEKLGIVLKSKIDKIFGRSLAIRVVDSGSDGAPEIELTNLTSSYYDIERYGICFVASPRHADILVITGPVTRNMAVAVKKTYDATPSPKFVIALGDDACGTGIFNGSYAVLGGVDKILPVDLKIPGNPPSPQTILLALIELMDRIKKR